ncbi:hypothetical protein niasHT_028702 [Heterodera trifolii]|uniref:Uncharacterized protein n=1 Tax=Heterodera trifolii TaxID=157864 RepID=A0ABD2JE72_9BILA
MGTCPSPDPQPHQPPTRWVFTHQQTLRPACRQPHGYLPITRPSAPSTASPMGIYPWGWGLMGLAAGGAEGLLVGKYPRGWGLGAGGAVGLVVGRYPWG